MEALHVSRQPVGLVFDTSRVSGNNFNGLICAYIYIYPHTHMYIYIYILIHIHLFNLLCMYYMHDSEHQDD